MEENIYSRFVWGGGGSCISRRERERERERERVLIEKIQLSSGMFTSTVAVSESSFVTDGIE